MAKFKVGNQVKIRRDLTMAKEYDMSLNPEMVECAGQEMTVLEVGHSDNTYILSDDGSFSRKSMFWWSEDMIEDKVQSTNFNLEVGMFIRFEGGKNIKIVTHINKDSHSFESRALSNSSIRQIYTYKYLQTLDYEVSYTYDFKDVIYKSVKSEPKLLTEEEKVVVGKWVDAIGREEVESVQFSIYGKGIFLYFFKEGECATSMAYEDKFKNVDLDKRYTLEELGL